MEFKEREKHFNTRIKRLNKAIHTDSLAQSESSTWIRNFDDDLTTREEELSDLTKRLEHESRALEEVTNELLPKTSGFQAKIEKRQRSLEPYTEEINRLEAEISVAQGEFSDLRERTTRVEVGLQDAKSRLAMIETNKRESVRVLMCRLILFRNLRFLTASNLSRVSPRKRPMSVPVSRKFAGPSFPE